jgi:hypothetical protein
MNMAKLPKAAYPLPQLTSGELLTYVSELRQALRTDLSDSDRDQVLVRLGAAFAEANERGMTVPESTEAVDIRPVT